MPTRRRTLRSLSIAICPSCRSVLRLYPLETYRTLRHPPSIWIRQLVTFLLDGCKSAFPLGGVIVIFYNFSGNPFWIGRCHTCYREEIKERRPVDKVDPRKVGREKILRTPDRVRNLGPISRKMIAMQRRGIRKEYDRRKSKVAIPLFVATLLIDTTELIRRPCFPVVWGYWRYFYLYEAVFPTGRGLLIAVSNRNKNMIRLRGKRGKTRTTEARKTIRISFYSSIFGVFAIR